MKNSMSHIRSCAPRSSLPCLHKRAQRLACLCALAQFALGLCTWGLTIGSARAEDRFAVEAFEPAPAQDGSLLNVHGARTLEKRAYSLSLVSSYARKPLSIESGTTGKNLGDLVGSVGTLTLLGAVGIWDRLDLGVALPIHRISEGSPFYGAPNSVNAVRVDSTQIALGDLRLVPRVSLLARQGEQGLGLALLTQVFLPTGKDSAYAGEPFRIEPRLALDWRSRGGMLLAMNAGYLVRREARVVDARIDDMVRGGLGVDVPIALGLSALAELDTQVNIFSNKFSREDAPTEGMLALRFRKAGWLAQLGGGPGLVRGITSPRYRLFASLTYTGFVEPERDSDRDGFLDKADGCPDQPEDKDGFQDQDGCPDPDNDADGVPDLRDSCVLSSEDHDGFLDDDGCPDLDDDADGIADTDDRCPKEPEDKDGFEDDDGCPEIDNDGDGVADAEDRCPNELGVPAEAGCPAQAQVVITEDTIQLHSPLYFAKNSAVIDPRSHPLLDEIARVILAHPEVTRVLVEGHTDDSGTVAHNRRLSTVRAAAIVIALVRRGVRPVRLRSAGFGPDRPLVPNDGEENRNQNRRVELRIEERTP